MTADNCFMDAVRFPIYFSVLDWKFLYITAAHSTYNENYLHHSSFNPALSLFIKSYIQK